MAMNKDELQSTLDEAFGGEYKSKVGRLPCNYSSNGIYGLKSGDQKYVIITLDGTRDLVDPLTKTLNLPDGFLQKTSIFMNGDADWFYLNNSGTLSPLCIDYVFASQEEAICFIEKELSTQIRLIDSEIGRLNEDRVAFTELMGQVRGKADNPSRSLDPFVETGAYDEIFKSQPPATEGPVDSNKISKVMSIFSELMERINAKDGDTKVEPKDDAAKESSKIYSMNTISDLKRHRELVKNLTSSAKEGEPRKLTDIYDKFFYDVKDDKPVGPKECPHCSGPVVSATSTQTYRLKGGARESFNLRRYTCVKGHRWQEEH